VTKRDSQLNPPLLCSDQLKRVVSDQPKRRFQTLLRRSKRKASAHSSPPSRSASCRRCAAAAAAATLVLVFVSALALVLSLALLPPAAARSFFAHCWSVSLARYSSASLS
jgi:hypothetical protein